MIAHCSVSFEFDQRPAMTWRGEIEGSAAHTVVHRAVVAAQKELRARSWSSLVVNILDRDDVVSDSVEGAEGSEI